VGTQYRSIILYNSPAQKAAAEKSMAEAQKKFKKPIVTQIAPLQKFYKATRIIRIITTTPNAGYCLVVIKPKVEKFEKKLKQEQEQEKKLT